MLPNHRHQEIITDGVFRVVHSISAAEVARLNPVSKVGYSTGDRLHPPETKIVNASNEAAEDSSIMLICVSAIVESQCRNGHMMS